jgi:pimeloyl-ACP methyl ester carboxylesterase
LPEGRPGTSGIASLEKITLGGVGQWILIRGTDVNAPLILKIHGGPGQAEMAAIGYNSVLEQNFVVVEWDQRGAGKSASAVDPVREMTLERIVGDTLELTQLLLNRFHKEKLILVGHSWGSVVAAHAAQEAPQLYYAFVTTGLITDTQQGWIDTWRYLVEEAGRRGNAEASRDLTEIGPPPYGGVDQRHRREVFGRWIEELGASWHSARPLDRVGMIVAAPEYSWPEKLGFLPAADRSFSLLWPDLASVDLKVQIPRLEVPVFVAAGRFDHLAPTSVSRQWFDSLVAPKKVWRWFENSAHFPMFEEPETFQNFLKEVGLESGVH